MKVIIQNLEKQQQLATRLVQQHNPDVLLAQEIDINGEDSRLVNKQMVSNTSKLGYGTAIYAKLPFIISDVVLSPHAEFGGFIYKKTTIGRTNDGIYWITFHGYNGQPFKNINNLCDHVSAVITKLNQLPDGKTAPSLFAGDFNTWTEAHLQGVKTILESAGYQLACSWKYPTKDLILDHAFIRGLKLIGKPEIFRNESDHDGAEIVLEVS
jgi:hypothetical protein